MKKRTKRIILACTVLLPFWAALLFTMFVAWFIFGWIGIVALLPAAFQYIFVELDEEEKGFQLWNMKVSLIFLFMPVLIVPVIREYIKEGTFSFLN